MSERVCTSMHFTTTSGTRLHYLEAGNISGPLLICLHGLGGSTETFRPLLPHLPMTHRIVLVDFQGFGKTPLNTSSSATISVQGHVADVRDLIASLHGPSPSPTPEDVVIVGHSLGAIVALHYASQYPETISGLALLGAGRAAGHIPAVRQRMLDLAAKVRADGIGFAADTAAHSNFYEAKTGRIPNPEAQDMVRKEVSSSNPEAYARTCEALVDDSHRDPEYNRIIRPTVFVAGDMDMISPVERSEDLSQLLGGTSWVEVVRSGHQPILEDLNGVRRAVDKLLGSVALCASALSLKGPRSVRYFLELSM